MFQIAITIPSFRRPQGLCRLLKALARLETSHQLTIIVGDNDPVQAEAQELCARFKAADYRWPLITFAVAQRGLASTRNAIVERALALPQIDYIAMLEDDEYPEPQWLDALIRMQQATKADVVGGTVLREFDEPPPLWALHLDGVKALRHKSGHVHKLTGSTGNVLFARAALSAQPRPIFDPQFSLPGGDYADLFRRLRQTGSHFAWCDEAVLRETVPASRLDRGWLLGRAYSIGNADMRLALKYRKGIAGEIVKIIAAYCALPEAALPSRRMQAIARMFRASGKLNALRGHISQPYRLVDGR